MASIHKGKRFEREAATLLTKSTGSQWQRVPQSGATATTKQLEQKSWFGDVFTEDTKYQDVIVECKHYNKLELSELFNTKSKLSGWIAKLELQAGQSTDWVLLVKADRKGTYALANYASTLSRLGLMGILQCFISTPRMTMIRIK